MVKFLIYVVVVLAVYAIAQLVRVFEIASALKGSKPHEINDTDNKNQGRMMLLFWLAFVVFCIWEVMEHGHKILPKAASDVGADIDWLMWLNMSIISVVFLITNTLLFYFAYKYQGSKSRTATFYPHNNKLELIWTVVPAVVLFVIIFLGIKKWNNITDVPSNDAIVIELYAKQFDWTARYAGKDNVLGKSNYKLISGSNSLGMDSTDKAGWDDMLVRNEFHIPKGKQISFRMNSRDIIHSAYFPHFRQQMNAVPGMTTEMHFVPTMTTKEMRAETKNDKFDYVLLCNKICGASHYNMQMIVVVDEEKEYAEWLSKQKPFFTKTVLTSNEENKKIALNN
ncbi:MAG: cytochrome c oxidase subunit II [Bacteroidetes bacterium]|nr:cytochrome c oxidase subunit II [Bacteroidota bacterium]